ncbi:formate dehydrogenase [Sphingomonas melonis TY]|uniref:Formate dehydrogenase n=1 Tax=Sphingomonas melonis TY TaxID=621456 RepID=A0A175Y2M8_9SPHN|nr:MULTISPECIES: FdhF/YdeP family oxidoreductase [Sphingomonas]MBI0531868.1 formate dehydrogenase [Sphingomonas sp. TX0522]ATI57142.1 formate dehydrogenase [Sphingomonas melonis]KZB94709.1 formate dehydrogenase [Sphingomonas melonis TY]MBX8845015.1 FdhF/YdeP family oxidoreductase [Sphingomonas melonis]MBX8854104.1 FdhF/YdeP family oxidoreductase [Sphingomonas melonis]
MSDDQTISTEPYTGPAGGWGSMKSVAEINLREKVRPETARELTRLNKPGGVMCVSCAWGKPAHPHIAEFCENGAKATAWELTTYRTTPEFFTKHTVSDLRGWKDYDLEQAGRLTHPMKYDAATDRYVAVSWAEAFADIGTHLKRYDPKKVIFYASGRASLETSYMWALMARLYGSQNLPDSSNMCHETTSVGLKSAIGSPVGTIHLSDYDQCDAIFYFGQNPGVNSPRFLHPLRSCAKRGVEIVVFNPLKERGLERFTDPQNPIEMATRKSTPIATQYHQVKAGGDIAALVGICKYVIEADDQCQRINAPAILDHAFIAEHTTGFEAFANMVRATDWATLEHESGITRQDMEAAGAVYAKSKRVICVYGMGLTQHVHGIDNLHTLVNLMLLRGNVGRPGAGFGPVRGHSNVQGQRTVGITEKPELAPLDRLQQLYDFDPPRDKGWDTVEACEHIIDGSAQAFLGLGGNLARAVPDTARIEPAWQTLDLTVSIATKLNRTHLLPGKTCYLLPCLGRIETDEQATGPQAVTMEDSFSRIYGSRGRATPAADTLLSEPAILAGIAKATLDPNPKVDWDAWVGDYGLVRDAIEATYPDKFARFNERMWIPGGFWKGVPAAHRQWLTDSGRAEFNVPSALNATGFKDAPGRFRLMTLRSNDQFNTTVYGYHDRFRGIKGTRDVVLMNRADMAELGLAEHDKVDLVGDEGTNGDKRVDGLLVVPYDIPRGCLGGYYPECNILMPVTHKAEQSHVPAGKSVPVRVEKAA